MDSAYRAWKNKELSDAQMALTYFVNRFAIDNDDRRLQKLINETSYEQILTNYQFKKVKGKAIVCLKKWVSGEWRLTLSEKIFTPYEVLAYQAKGIRPVTMKFHDTSLPIMHRRNSLDFFIHDLEHGYMFFNDKELMKMQRNFFRRIESSLATGIWQEKLKDKLFKEKFYYMISDMNSHQEHYKAYLRAMLPHNEFEKFEFLFSESV